MAKPEWGTKRTCPNCGERFYDLGKNDPVVCIDCGHDWVPEPILKTKQPVVVVEEEKKTDAETTESEDDIAVDGDIDLSDDDVDLEEISLDDDDDAEVAGMVDTSLSDDES